MKSILIQNFLNIALKICVYNSPLPNERLEERHIGEILAKESKNFEINLSMNSYTKHKFFIRFKTFENLIIGDFCVIKPFRILKVGNIKCGKSYGTGYTPIIKDMPEIYIHNLTGVPLLFNGHISVPPRKEIKYTGYDQTGIQSGFTLKNDDGIFNDFTILRALTNIYYGLISSE
jgi:hypothetical protein